MNMLRTIVNAAFERARPFAAPIGLTIAEAGLIALRAAVETLTVERDELEKQCEARRAYLAGGPDYLDAEPAAGDVVDQADDLDRRNMTAWDEFRAAESPGAVRAAEPLLAADPARALLDRLAEADQDTASAPAGAFPLASDYLNNGWWLDTEHNVWRPPGDAKVAAAASPANSWPVNPNVVRAEEVAPEPPLVAILHWTADDDLAGAVCRDDGAEVVVVWNDKAPAEPGTYLCTKCERTCPEPSDRAAARVAQLALQRDSGS